MEPDIWRVVSVNWQTAVLGQTHRKLGYLPKLRLQLMNLTSLNTRGHFIESAANKYRYPGDYCEQAHIGIKQKLMIDTILKHFVYMLHVGLGRLIFRGPNNQTSFY